MLACGSVAFVHLWQYTTHCHIRPAICRGQIAILLQDEVSLELIRFPQSLWEKKKKRGQFLFISCYTCAHTRANRCAPAEAVTAYDLPCQSEHTNEDFQKVMIILARMSQRVRQTQILAYAGTQAQQSCSSAAHWCPAPPDPWPPYLMDQGKPPSPWAAVPTHTLTPPPPNHVSPLSTPSPTLRGPAISWAEPFCTSLISTQD